MSSSFFTGKAIEEAIQLATAPVFFLAGIGAFMNVIAGRLARVVDRARYLETLVTADHTEERERQIEELRTLEKRMNLSARAIYFCTASALLVCLLIITLFAEEMVRLDLGHLIAVMFVIAVVMLAIGMVLFLRETRIAVGSLHVREDLFELTGGQPPPSP